MILRAVSGAVAACLLLGVAFATAGTAGAATRVTSSLPVVDDKARTPAATTRVAPRKAGSALPLLPSGGPKEPITVNADALDILNKDNKLVYTGHVVAVQGESALKASKLNIDLDKNVSSTGPQAPATAADPPGGSNSVRHMEADGPVTLTSKDQVGTGDHATYDKLDNKFYLKGSVTLTQGPNITQGDSLVYDMTSGQARVVGHVRSVLTPNTRTQDTVAKDQADVDSPR